MASGKKILKVLDTLTLMAQNSIESLDAASETPKNEIKSIIESKNVLAVGISEKISKKKKTGKLALIFYVEKKIALNKLKKSQLIPKTIPRSLTGGSAVQTDVIAIGKLQPEINSSRTSFQPGNSIGHIKIEAGTFGAVVKDKNNKLYILSNCHVLADSGKGKIGDKILYPGAFDTGVSPADAKATLHKFIPFKISKEFTNVVDCALAAPLNEFLPSLKSEIKSWGLPKGVIKPKRGMKVVKVGRTTGKTTSVITDVNFRTMMDYKKKGLKDIRFKDQIWCEKRYTMPGDSGSLIIDKASGKAVGLHFAGAEGGSAHNPITEVLAALDVKLVTSTLSKKKPISKTKSAKRK